MSTRQTLLTELLTLFRTPERYAVPKQHEDLTNGLAFLLEPSQEQRCQLAFVEQNVRFHTVNLPVRKRLKYRRRYLAMHCGIESRTLAKDVLVYDDVIHQDAPDQQSLQAISHLLSTKQTDELFGFWLSQPTWLQHLLPLHLRATVRRMPNDGMHIRVFSLSQSRPLIQLEPASILPLQDEDMTASQVHYPKHIDLEWQYDQHHSQWICRGMCESKTEWFRLNGSFFGNNLYPLVAIALKERIVHDGLFCPCMQFTSRRLPKVLGKTLTGALNLGLSTIPKLVTLGISYQLDKRQAYLFGIAQTPVDYFRLSVAEIERLRAAFTASTSTSATSFRAPTADHTNGHTQSNDDGLPSRTALSDQSPETDTRVQAHGKVTTPEPAQGSAELLELLTGLGKRALVNSALDEPIYQQLFELFFHLKQYGERLQRVPLYADIEYNLVRLSLCSQSNWQLIKTMLTTDTDFAKPLMVTSEAQSTAITQLLKHPWHGKYLLYWISTMIYAHQQLPQKIQDRKALNDLLARFSGLPAKQMQALLSWMEAVTKHTNLRELLRKQLNNHRQQKLLQYYRLANSQLADTTTPTAHEFNYQIEMVSGGTAQVTLSKTSGSKNSSDSDHSKDTIGLPEQQSWVLALALEPAISSPSTTKSKALANIKVLIKSKQAHVIFVVSNQRLLQTLRSLLPQLQKQLKQLGYESSVSISGEIATKRQLGEYQNAPSYNSHGFKV